MSNTAMLDTSPPGAGFDTVTFAVPTAARSLAKMLACTREVLMKLVLRGLPFQFTTAPLTNPAPLTVS